MTLSYVENIQPLNNIQAIALGYVDGAQSVYKFGYNSGVGTTELPVVNGATSAFQYATSASVMQVSSTATTDTTTASGARTIFIEGLDGNYNEVSETVSMSGQTQVATVNSYLRVNRSYVLTAGNSVPNIGRIYIGIGTATAGVINTWYNTIVAGDGQSLQAVYTVPANYTGLINYMAVTAGRTTATGFITWRLVSRDQGAPFRSRNKFDTAAAGGEIEIQYIYSPIVLASGTDVEVRALGSVANNACSAHVSITLVPTVT